MKLLFLHLFIYVLAQKKIKSINNNKLYLIIGILKYSEIIVLMCATYFEMHNVAFHKINDGYIV